ncbi:unnamed protein product [Urochloa decumbens]|uniref:PWWP domain-containing protein n=1 Tax=Urochloa decumbens TaxID=240449 RepID=A0ABC9H0U0_9POAL
MSDPAAAGAIVPAAGGGSAWANGAPRFGDMVWGKVKSHPWWPGHIYSIDLTDDEEVHRGRRDGLVLVAFFGDSSYGWFEPQELVPFEDHFAEKAAQGGGSRSSFAAAVAEAVDEVARRSALALLCPCRDPDAFRPHPGDGRFFLVDVPGFDSDADYHPDQIQAARDRFVPRMALDYLLGAAATQRDAAETSARTVPGIEMAGLFMAYRRTVFAPRDDTYAEAFGVDPEKVLEAEKKAAADRAQRARPLKGGPRKDQATPTPGRRRGGAGGAAARLMEKIVPGASAMKAKASKKDQYLLKRRDPPELAHRAPPPPLPDAPPTPAPAALEDGPPGFRSGDPPTPPHPGSSLTEEEEFMLQRRAPLVEVPAAAQATEGSAAAPAAAAAADAAPKKATKAKKPRKREREEAADAGPDAAAAGGEPKKKKKKKKLNDLEGIAAAGLPAPEPNGLDLTQVLSDIRNLPLAPFNGADRRISDAARSFVLAFRSKYYKKSYENDPPEESKRSLDKPGAIATDGQPVKKKKMVVRPGAVNDPTRAGVKRGPSDRQEELAVKKKAKLDKIKTLSSEKKAAGVLEQQRDSSVPAPASQQQQQQARAGAKEKADVAAAKKKQPAPAPKIMAPSPTALIVRFPLQSTLPSVASLKARFARFGPLNVEGIRVYWKSHSCRVVYNFRSDAEAALRYAQSNAMFGQVGATYSIKDAPEFLVPRDREPAAQEAPPSRSELRLMETAPFRPGSSGNGAPLPMSRAAMPARPALGQQPKSILKKSTDDGGAGTSRDAPRVKFMLDGGDSKLEPPTPPATGAESSKGAKSVGFAPQQPARTLQPSIRPAQPPLQQPLRATTAAVTQQLPPPPPLPYQPRASEGLVSAPGQQQLPYPSRYTEAPPSAFSNSQPPPPPYLTRHSEGPSALPGPPPLPYPPRPAGLFPGQQLQQQQEIPAWKRSKEEFQDEVWRLMTGIAKMVEPLTDKNGFFPYHLFRAQ